MLAIQNSQHEWSIVLSWLKRGTCRETAATLTISGRNPGANTKHLGANQLHTGLIWTINCSDLGHRKLLLFYPCLRNCNTKLELNRLIFFGFDILNNMWRNATEYLNKRLQWLLILNGIQLNTEELFYAHWPMLFVVQKQQCEITYFKL